MNNTLKTILDWNPIITENLTTHTLGQNYKPAVVSHKVARKLGTHREGKRRINDSLPEDLKNLRDTAQTMKLFGRTKDKKLGQKYQNNYEATGKGYISGIPVHKKYTEQ